MPHPARGSSLLQGWSASTRAPCQARHRSRRVAVSNSAAAEPVLRRVVSSPQDARRVRPDTAMMVVMGTTLGSSLAVVNEVQVPRPKTGAKRALNEQVPYVESEQGGLAPLQEAHSCHITPMAVAPASLGTHHCSNGAPMLLALVPSHRHYTITHAHQRRLASFTPCPTPIPASATPCPPTPSTSTPSSPSKPPVVSRSSPASSQAPSHIPHPSTVQDATPAHLAARTSSHCCSPPASTASCSAASSPACRSASTTASLHSSAPCSRPQPADGAAQADAAALAATCSGTTHKSLGEAEQRAAAAQADAAAHSWAAQAVAAIVARTRCAVAAAAAGVDAPVGVDSAARVDSPAGVDSAAGVDSPAGASQVQEEGELRALLQRYSVADLAILCGRLQQYSDRLDAAANAAAAPLHA